VGINSNESSQTQQLVLSDTHRIQSNSLTTIAEVDEEEDADERSVMDRFTDAAKELWYENPAGRWVVGASFVRWIGVQSISFYLPLYF